MSSGGRAQRIRVVIADDEPLGRQRIEALLGKHDDIDVVASVGDGAQAVEAIRTLHPDLVFLDIQMPGFTGFDVVREVGAVNMPATIFVTAYDQHALRAFDLHALDYLVKPFDDERFEDALRRARRLVELEAVDRLRGALLEALQPGAAPLPHARTQSREYLERIPVESKGRVRVVSVSDIDYIVAAGVYAELFVGDRRYVVRESMQTLEEKLDPDVFMRIHRSAIVRLSRIDVFLRGEGGDYNVQLKNGVKLPVSRARRAALEQKMGLDG
jgi:two-component system LytT family response regulator